jgi:DNA polymerase elongation subunit (family B)
MESVYCTNPVNTYILNNPLHGKYINYSELDDNKTELSRNFYIDQCFPQIRDEINEKLKKKKDILFMPIFVNDDKDIQDVEYSPYLYKVIISGVLEDGRRAMVVLNGICPYVEVMVPDDVEPEKYKNELINELLSISVDEYNNVTGESAGEYFTIKISNKPSEIVYGKYFKEFKENNSAFVRIYFNKIKPREYAIKYMLAKGYKTTHNDLNNYQRVVCRDYLISFCTWCKLSKYKKETNHARINGLVFTLDVTNYTTYNDTRPHLQKDPTMSMCWDIETYKKYDPNSKEPPVPSNPKHLLFMIGLTFQWYHSSGNGQLLRICIVDKPSIAHPDYLTIECGDEKNILKAFIKIWSYMMPDLILGFNDGEYDWPWLKYRIESNKLLKFMAKSIALIKPPSYDNDPWAQKKIISNYYKSISNKLDSETNYNTYKFKFDSYVAIDVRIIFRQLFPTDESSSLNHYLTRLDIPTKLDINFKDMFDMYEEMQTLQENGNELPARLLIMMQQVAHYCVIDSQRCHELMVKMNVIMDKRAVANMSYVSLSDAVERANGMKVRNLIIAAGQAHPFNLKFNNIPIKGEGQKSKYPGAYVFPPKKGLVNGKMTIQERIDAKIPGWDSVTIDDINKANELIDLHGAVLDENQLHKHILPNIIKDFLTEEIRRPITGLDFNSLYPSLMMTYNLSPEYMILDRKYAQEMMNKHTLFRIKFPFKGENVSGWIVRHDNHIDPTKSDFKFGIFGYVLKELFDKRKAIKGQMKSWEHAMEEAEEDSQEYNNARFQYEYLNSMQKALKVFMNTFYGEIGNQRSSFFMVQVAGGITINGARYVRLAQKFTEEKGCKIYYGDTDSIYISMPDIHFNFIDRQYFLGRINKMDYWSKLVEITLRVVVDIRNEINEYFKKDNGTSFLVMAFEEALFPVLFVSKKKYVGIAHENHPSFAKPLNISELQKKFTKELTIKFPEHTAEEITNLVDDAIILKRKKQFFIRGLDIVKRGMPNFAKEIVLDILEKMIDINNTMELIDIVKEKLKEVYSHKWDDPSLLYKFIMSDQYKPHKKNEKMNVFVRRMEETYNIKIRPFERVRYIIAFKYPYKFDIRGNKEDLSIGERMELAELCVEHKHIIDINEYMKSKVFGQLARLVSYHSDFYPSHMQYDLSDDNDVKLLEKAVSDMANRWIKDYCGQFSGKHCMLAPVHRTISKAATEITFNKLGNIDDRYKQLLMPKTDDELIELPNWILMKVISEAEKRTKNYGSKYIKKLIENYKENKKSIKLPIGRNGVPIYKSVEEYLCVKITPAYKRIYELTEGYFYIKNDKYMNDLTNHIAVIRHIYYKINDLVRSTSEYVVSSVDIAPLYEQGVSINMMENSIEKIKDFIAINQENMANNININEELFREISIYNNIYDNLVSIHILLYQQRSIIDELTKVKDKRTGYIPIQNVDINSLINMMNESM